MKKLFLLLLGAAALVGASFGLAGCVGEVGVETPGVYFDGGGPWAYGHGYYHGGGWGGRGWGGVHPPRR
jgi:hypothetical protein